MPLSSIEASLLFFMWAGKWGDVKRKCAELAEGLFLQNVSLKVYESVTFPVKTGLNVLKDEGLDAGVVSLFI